MKGYLALLTTVGFIAVLLGLGSGALKTVESPAVLILFGALATNWGNVIGYYFGAAESQRAPQRKTDERSANETNAAQ